MKNIPQPYSWDTYRVKESHCLAQRLEKIYPIQPFSVGLVYSMNKTFWQNFPSRTETQPREKTWDREITSKRQSLRETARIWRYLARTGGWKPETSWNSDCPLCEFFRCSECPLNHFWGAFKPQKESITAFLNQLCLCVNSTASAYYKWRESCCGVRTSRTCRYYALRIRWAALRVLNDHFSS